ncbi:MAG: hypothetical protein A3I61_04510 [Acidobacteria bacterium RIFCSPLOWO2_02_FULL_68_18]|nr:MAG: hypothetical protein A3I61_04510 [Acidobacteria bacterium RIFCSPLOWO2_02_FULL_68_18]OFW48422.1 MAG: hypothetical protein A3G77_13115 [Acidobacteria bacterium RIFCSPLOWO2_12_FULL_68_19]
MNVIAAAYLAAHLPFLAPSLEDYDSINFALGLRDFDPARHQPHPPGSPVYIALGRLLLAPIAAVWPSARSGAAEALTLALWSAVAGAVAIIAVARVFAAVNDEPRTSGSRTPDPGSRATWAAALLAAGPLFWMSGLRPMSDLPGLAAALVAQAVILGGRSDPRRLALGAAVAGMAAGIRVQTILLTAPLLALALWQARRFWRPVGALAAATLAWAVPLVVSSGGLDGYLRALGSQAGEDFAWVNMLWLEPTPRRLAFALYETFVLPWGSTTLAAVVAVAAALGGVLTLARERSSLVLLLVAFAPYAAFHLLLQETITVRYAIPTLPVVVWLAIRGAGAFGRFMPAAALPLVIGALVVVVPAGVAYGREPHPAFRAIADASKAIGSAPPGAVFAHHSVWRALQVGSALPPVAEPPRLYEWLGPVGYWKNGGTAPVWFFADPRRTDLALIDPQARLDVDRYRWAVADRPEFGGSRPVGADWYRIADPGWFAGEGWALTPETGGLARARGAGPDFRPTEAWVRRRPGPLHLVVGGRHLGDAGDPAAEFELVVDGVVRDRWRLSFEERNFLRFLDLPDGIAEGEGRYARLTIASRAVGGDSRRAPVGVRQFDIQSVNRLLHAFAEGWHEDEYDPATGRRWRWTSERAVVRVKGASGGIRLIVRGESPLRYFDGPPTVRVTAGGRVVAQFQPAADFEWAVVVPAADVARAGGALAIETDRVYLPGQAEGTSDERRLGLRVYECRVYPLLP